MKNYANTYRVIEFLEEIEEILTGLCCEPNYEKRLDGGLYVSYANLNTDINGIYLALWEQLCDSVR